MPKDVNVSEPTWWQIPCMKDNRYLLLEQHTVSSEDESDSKYLEDTVGYVLMSKNRPVFNQQ